MRNTLGDLNNHLFAEIERLGDESTTGEELEQEIQRARAVTAVSSQVIQNAKLILEAAKFRDDKLSADDDLPELLEG